MFTPPVGRCSVLVCDGLFLCNYYSQEKTNVFGFLCMGEKTFGQYFWYRFVYQNRISLRITLKETRYRKRNDLFCLFLIFLVLLTL